MKPLILLTNDDGIHSPGLLASAEALQPLGDLLVVAPHTQQTGMGRSFHRTPDLGVIDEVPLHINGTVQTGYGVHGTPAYAVAHAIVELTGRKPDLCVSGINYGENLGMVLTCSGTVGAVLEACSHNVPGIAVSLQVDLKHQRSNDYLPLDWDKAKLALHYWVKKTLQEGALPYHAPMLNINIPYNLQDALQYRFTRQSRQNYFEFVPPVNRDFRKPVALDSRLRVYTETLEPDSDIYAVHVENVTSVTPLNWDMSIDL